MKLASILICVLFSGCAHRQLNRNTLRQVNVLSELYEQQVLDNLAMLAANPGSTPSFGLPNGGGTNLSHGNTLNGGLNWSPLAFTGANLGLNGSRTVTQNWTLEPVNDPRRLQLMKCAYQHSLGCYGSMDSYECPDLLRRFFASSKSTLNVPTKFFVVSDSEPSNDDCCVKWGTHCDCYVVVSNKNFHCLSELTLAILEIATISDESLTERLHPTVEDNPTVEITETFVQLGEDGSPRLIQGNYRVGVEDYKNQYEVNALSLQDIPMLFDALGTNGDSSFNEMLQKNGILENLNSGRFDINDIEIKSSRPTASPAQSGTRRPADPSSRIEALLQLNATPLVAP